MLGNGGKLKINAVDVDVVEWEVNAEIPEIENTQGGAAHWSGEEGRPKVPFTATIRFNAAAEAQIFPRFTGATPTAGAVPAVLYLNGTKNLAGNVIFNRIGTGVKVMANEIIIVPIAGTFTGALTYSGT